MPLIAIIITYLIASIIAVGLPILIVFLPISEGVKWDF